MMPNAMRIPDVKAKRLFTQKTVFGLATETNRRSPKGVTIMIA